MDESDLIKALQNLARRGPSTYGESGLKGLKDMLGGIQTNPDNRHGTAPWLRWIQSQLGTIDAVEGRPP
jgi:hypothetical protein